MIPTVKQSATNIPVPETFGTNNRKRVGLKPENIKLCAERPPRAAHCDSQPKCLMTTTRAEQLKL